MQLITDSPPLRQRTHSRTASWNKIYIPSQHNTMHTDEDTLTESRDWSQGLIFSIWTSSDCVEQFYSYFATLGTGRTENTGVTNLRNGTEHLRNAPFRSATKMWNVPFRSATKMRNVPRLKCGTCQRNS